MNYKLFLLFFLLFSVTTLFAQPKPKPTAKPAANELAKLMIGIGLPYKMVSDTVAVIAYEGVNIPSYNLVIQKTSDLFLIYTNLSEAVPNKINETKYKYLLQQNDNFDVIKIGLGLEDNNIYVRADLYKSGISTALLQRIIKQVANVTNIMAGDLK